MRRKKVPLSWICPITDFIAVYSNRGHAPSSVEIRRYQLCRFARDIAKPPYEVTAEDLERNVGEHLKSGQWKAETARAMRSTHRVFYEWAHKTGRMPHNPAGELAQIKPGDRNPKPVSEDAFHAAVTRESFTLTIAGKPSRAYSDPALIRMALRISGELGLRRAEVAQIHRDHILETADGYELKVLGKGSKTRFLPLLSTLHADLVAHIDARGGGFAFPSRRSPSGHLSPHWLGTLVSNALPEGYTMHKLRHRFATQMYRRGDLLMASELLGHSNIGTTQIYVLPDRTRHRTIMGSLASGQAEQ